MKYVIFKLTFKAPVHFGQGRLSGGGFTFYADTLFSALCNEGVKLLGEQTAERLYNMAAGGELLLSDGMPYFGEILFIPKPIIAVEGERESNSSLKKKFKNLKYIPLQDIEAFVSGAYNPDNAADALKNICVGGIRANVSIKNNADNSLFNVGIYTFKENAGLYFIAGLASPEAETYVFDIMDSLSYTGIGGKLSSGFGSFDYTYSEKISDDLSKMLTADYSAYMSLSVSMAKSSELDSVLEGASYKLIKRSGFLASSSYSGEPLKKKEMFCFCGGSCFKKRFEGDVFDVSCGGKHSVYRYAKPLLIGIRQV